MLEGVKSDFFRLAGAQMVRGHRSAKMRTRDCMLRDGAVELLDARTKSMVGCDRC